MGDLCGSWHYNGDLGVKDVRPRLRPLFRGLNRGMGTSEACFGGRSGMQAPLEGGAPVPSVFATHGTGLRRDMPKCGSVWFHALRERCKTPV